MEQQDDGVCPFRLINGVLWDFRCYICKKLPRAGMANRSELYRHYSLYHFSKQLVRDFGHLRQCPVPTCGKACPNAIKIGDHMGQVHDMVEKYLPAENRLPRKLPKDKSQRPRWEEWEDIPPGYRPRDRSTVHTEEVLLRIVEGFQVHPDLVVCQDELDGLPAWVQKTLSSYPGYSGSCLLCLVDPTSEQDETTLEALFHHLLQDHRLSLDLEGLEDIVEYLITEAGYIKLKPALRQEQSSVTPNLLGAMDGFKGSNLEVNTLRNIQPEREKDKHLSLQLDTNLEQEPELEPSEYRHEQKWRKLSVEQEKIITP